MPGMMTLLLIAAAAALLYWMFGGWQDSKNPQQALAGYLAGQGFSAGDSQSWQLTERLKNIWPERQTAIRLIMERRSGEATVYFLMLLQRHGDNSSNENPYVVYQHAAIRLPRLLVRRSLLGDAGGAKTPPGLKCFPGDESSLVMFCEDPDKLRIALRNVPHLVLRDMKNYELAAAGDIFALSDLDLNAAVTSGNIDLSRISSLIDRAGKAGRVLSDS